MKMAAAEALWESESPASFSLFTWGDEGERRDVFAIRVPALLSFLSYNRFEGEVKGIKDLQAEYEQRFGPGDYVPPVAISYWSFRVMVGAGGLMALLALLAVYLVMRDRVEQWPLLLRLMPWAIALPYAANSAGWILTEVGRAPWLVFGLQRLEQGLSKAVSFGELAFSLVIFVLLYGALMAADVFLLLKYARGGTAAVDQHAEEAAPQPAQAS
jgi:cytochrome d ubiquinol oxidase subunit I